GQLDVRVTSARWDAQAQRLAVQVVNRSRYDLTELTCGLQHARTDQGRFAIQKGTCPPGGSAWFISDRLTPRYDFRPPGIHRLLGARGSSSNAAAPPNPAPAQRLVRLPAEDHKLVDIRSRDAKWDAKSGRLSVLVVNRTQYTITEITCTLDDALPDTGTFIPEAGACPPGAARWFVASKLQARQQFRTPNIDGLMGVVVVGRR
ncbi:MAG: hypothetical protein OER86_11435, partial [Phycisphaerae bacterium]|nr:hypothetical protein [Phycisphaerae bacterium]